VAWPAKLARCARADKTWKVLEDAIHEINNHNASGLSFEELYRSAPCPARAVGQASAGTAVRARGSPVWRPAAEAPVLPAQWCWTLLAGRCVVPSTRSLQPSGANDEVQRPLVNGQLVAVLAGRPRPRLTTAPPPRRRNAYNMVINKFGDRLYNGLVETITGHLRSVAGRVEAAQGEGFLRELKTRWEAHNKSMQMIRDILMVRGPLGPSEPEPAPTHAHSSLQACPPVLCAPALSRLRNLAAREQVGACSAASAAGHAGPERVGLTQHATLPAPVSGVRHRLSHAFILIPSSGR